MNTIIINDANKQQASVISKLAELLKLNVTIETDYSSSKAAIDASIEAYENGLTQGLKVSVKDFKKMIDGLKQDN
jgi:hypothetical protein